MTFQNTAQPQDRRQNGPWSPLPWQRCGKLTFVVKEAAVHQDKPAFVPLLHPGAGLQDTQRDRWEGHEPGVEAEADAVRELCARYKDILARAAALPLARGSSSLEIACDFPVLSL